MGLSVKYPVQNNDPAFGLLEVTPSDSVPLKADLTPTRAISCAVSGTIKFTMADGSVGDAYLAAGIMHPVRAVYVWSAGTDATTIRAWF